MESDLDCVEVINDQFEGAPADRGQRGSGSSIGGNEEELMIFLGESSAALFA